MSVNRLVMIDPPPKATDRPWGARKRAGFRLWRMTRPERKLERLFSPRIRFSRGTEVKNYAWRW